MVKQYIKVSRTLFWYFIAGLLLLLAALLLWTNSKGVNATHVASYDPYADSVNSSSVAVVDPNNAVGAPNGTAASLAGLGASITLDMGNGEEGTQALKLYLGQINAQVNILVEFLDKNNSVIKSESRQLGVDLNASSQNFDYNWANFGKAYRFVRISTPLGGGVNVDAAEALGYLGSSATQDTDGDGRDDRSEQHGGTNPLAYDQFSQDKTNVPTRPSTNPSTNPGASASPAGVSEQVNDPPTDDQDKDGMADEWERTHGTDPANDGDASADTDGDGLNNLAEYRLGSDPRKSDSDGDGMPDKWEFEHALDINHNDANADPDGDFLTNLGEYKHNTDPNKADNLSDVFGKDCGLIGKGGMDAWDWLLFILLVSGGLLAWVKALSEGDVKTKKLTKKK